MKFSLSLPIDHIEPKGEFQNPQAIREIAARIEATRAAGCSLTEHPAPDSQWLREDPAGHDTLEPFSALAFVAAVTQRLRLITTVIVLPYRNPFLSAKAATTLQMLSGGRFIFGVGAGYLRGEFEAMGVPMNRRGALTDEALETIRRAWTGESIVKQGLTFNAIGNEQRPIPEPAPPIWIGGGSTRAMERAARWGDGWGPFITPPTENPDLKASGVGELADMAAKVARCHELRAELGRSGPFDIYLPLPAWLRERTPAQAEQIAEMLSSFETAGVNWTSITLPAPSRAEFYENLIWFDEEVMAKFAD
jgi:probable F420-dependent oxidoreductase